MSSQVKIASQRRGRWAWPVVGFVLIVSLSILAYFIAPSVQDAISEVFPTFKHDGISRQNYQLIVAGFTFVILLLLATMVVTMAGRRKRPLDVKNSTLEKERNQMILDKKAMKRRQRRLNQEMRDYVKNNPKG